MSLYRIDKLFSFEKGTLQSSKCEAGEYDFITASAEWKTHKEYVYDCEALVFAAAASGSLGRTHYVNGKFIASDLCFVLTPKDPAKFPIDLRFYHIIFNELRSDIVKNTKAGTSKEAISLGNFARYELPYFEIEKQIEIKNQFVYSEKTKETLTSELTRQLDLVKQLRQAFLREAMQGRLVPQDPKDEPASELLKKIKATLRQAQGDKKGKKQKELPPVKEEEIPFEIPGNWSWCRLGEIIELISGQHIETNDYNEKGDGFPYLTGPSDFGVKYPQPSRWTTKPKVFAGAEDILITVKGAGVGKINICNIKKMVISRQLMAIRPIQIDRDFVYHFLETSFDLLQSEKRGTGIPGISRENIIEKLIPLPPLAEQHRIVAKLEQLMQLCDELEQSIRQSKELTDMLLQTALREQMKIIDIDQIPARRDAKSCVSTTNGLTPEDIAVVEGKG